MKRGWSIGRIFVYIVLVLGALIMMLPFLWMVTTSLKVEAQVFTYPPQWLPSPIYWKSYSEAWSLLPWAQGYMNSIKIAAIVTVGTLFSCSLAGYAFAKIDFPGKNLIFLLLLGTIIIPAEVLLIPLFILFREINWLDSHLPLIVPSVLSNPFGVFLMRQFIMSIPSELEDAARIDGCNYWLTYTRIILPLTRPALAALCIFTFMGSWNQFLSPLIYIDSLEKFTVPILLQFYGSLHMGYANQYTPWNQTMAVATLATLPVLLVFIFLQKYFVKGITLTGIKG